LQATQVKDSPRRVIDSIVRIVTENPEPHQLLYDFLLNEILRETMEGLNVQLEAKYPMLREEYPLRKSWEPAMNMLNDEKEKKVLNGGEAECSAMSAVRATIWDIAYNQAECDARIAMEPVMRDLHDAVRMLEEQEARMPRIVWNSPRILWR
jgi:hypothetical protein